jgi:D-alanyl-D-alanine carboxypeptidase (penicillin-binding protein 5/6)
VLAFLTPALVLARPAPTAAPVSIVAAASSTTLSAAPLPPAPPIDARAYMVENPVTGDVLASKNADAQLPIASLTKLMTVDVALHHLSIDRYITVSAAAAEVGEESAGLRAGEQILVGDLVEAALIQSANDAADALADAASNGNRALFASWMNAEARTLGLTHTHFVRPDGLDAPDHYSSARDITRLARAVMGLSAVRQAVKTSSTTISGGRTLTAWNDLLGVYPGVVGVKTGHTDDAGWCQVTLLERDGVQVYVTILGAPTRERRNHDITALLDYARSRYRSIELVTAHDPLGQVKTEYGGPAVPVAASRSLKLPVRVDRPLTEKIVLPRTLSLPVSKGARVGEVRVYSKGRVVGRRELVAMRSVSKRGLFGKLGWYGGQTIQNLFGWI